jgi:sodium transport system permease protein
MSELSSTIQRIWIIFHKEMVDNLRDRRSIISALSSSLIGPALIVIMIMIVGKTFYQDQIEKPLHLPVAGKEFAPTLITFLEQHNVIIEEAPKDLESAVIEGDVEMILVIPDSYGEDFNAGRPAKVQLIIDTSRQSSTATISRAQQLLGSYSQLIASLRLQARGINPDITHPLAVENVDVATPRSQVMIFLNMMPYFVILTIFIGGMYVVIDATAGERERGSLEPLLINPVPRRDFVFGKLSASIPFAFASLTITLLAFALAFNLTPLEDYIGFQLTIDVRALGNICLISLPMIVLASSLQMIIVSFTRSFKEAQTYTGLLPLVPALPGIFMAFLPIKPLLWMMLIPTFGQQILINQFLRGETINLLHIIVSCIMTLLLSIVLVWISIRLYNRERIIFGTR